MKKILLPFIATFFFLTTLAFAAPTDSPRISGDKFAEITGLPGNLPEGWTFSPENEVRYRIYPPQETAFNITFSPVTRPGWQNLTAEQARKKYISERPQLFADNHSFFEFEDQYGQTKVASILDSENSRIKTATTFDFFSFNGKLYYFYFIHYSGAKGLQIARKSVLQSVLTPINQ